ncbi:MAG: formate dehydrogenase accessory protein FdhE [Candidatus Sulfotelmatobacter sp.]
MKPQTTWLHVFVSKPDNRSVANTAWQQRIRRAQHLAAQHPFATEILGFYIHIARFQEGFYQRLEHAFGKNPVSLFDPNSDELAASFPSFLSLVEERGPARVAYVAHGLRASDPDSWTDLFTQYWTHIDAPSDPQEFLVLAFFQPYAELARSRASLRLEGYTSLLCPFCNRKPALGVLRQQGDGGRRSLLCGVCMTEWEFRRVICPGCGHEDHAKLPVYTAAEMPYIRVECCDDCKTYIKCVDLTKNGLADPVVDELASVPLNLWAQEHGYAKLRPNLLGM